MKRSAPLRRRTPLRAQRAPLPRRRSQPRREQPGDRDPAYLAIVRKLRCCARDLGTPCRGRIDAHHPRHLARGAGLKAPDDCAIPLCRWHHVFELHANAGAFKRWSKQQLRGWQDIRVREARQVVAIHRAAAAAVEKAVSRLVVGF